MKRKIIIILIIFVIGLLGYVPYSGFMYVNSYYKHEHIKAADVELIHYQPGIGSTIQSIRTTDEHEIAEVIGLLNDRTVIKLFPNTGPVKANANDMFEIQIEFISDRNLTLEYRIFSTGRVQVNKGFNNKDSNTLVFGGSKTKWFNEINALYEEKKQNPLWFKS